MATITINIPAETTTRVIDGFCYTYGYSPILSNGSPNPETKAQFAKRKVLEYIRNAVRRAEIEQAANAAAGVAATSVDTDIVLS